MPFDKDGNPIIENNDTSLVENKPEVEPEKEDVSGLKSALQKEREARKAMEAKIKAFEAQRQELEVKSLEEKQQWKELAEKYKSQNQQLQAERVDMQKKTFAADIIGDLTADAKKARLLREQVLKHVDYQEGQIRISGLADVETPDKMREWLREEFSFLVDGNKASGGGAAAASGGGSAKKEIKLSDFNRLSYSEQMRISKEGYAIIKD
jgi:ribosomal protein L9